MNRPTYYGYEAAERDEEFESLLPKKDDRFKQTAYKDMWASIIFGVAFFAFIIISTFSIPFIDIGDDGDNGKEEGLLTKNELGEICVLAVVSSFLLSFTYFYFLKRFAGKMIYGSFLVSIAVQFLAGTVMLMSYFKSQLTGQLFSALILLGFGILSLYFYSIWKSRIPFARVMLRSVTEVISKYPATLLSGLFGLFAQSLFGIYWLVTMVGVSQWLQEDNSAVFIALYAVLMFFWTTQVIQNTVHVTVSGLFGTYYFLGENVNGQVTISVHNPTVKAAKRALTTSFGPICYGSLVIALVQLLRFIINYTRQSARDHDNAASAVILCCLECIVSLFEGLLEYFNKYAFTQVAVYGKDYCSAGRDTWELCKSRGIDALINDDLIGNVLGLGSLAIGIVSAGVMLFYVYLSSLPQTNFYFYSIGAIGFVIGVVQFSILSTVIDSGVATTFVCLAEDPAALAQTKPELYHAVQEAYPHSLLFV